MLQQSVQYVKFYNVQCIVLVRSIIETSLGVFLSSFTQMKEEKISISCFSLRLSLNQSTEGTEWSAIKKPFDKEAVLV